MCVAKTYHCGDGPIDPASWDANESENVCEFLIEKFAEWPEGARLYHENVSVISDITPTNEQDVEKIEELEGTFYCVVYPESVTVIIIALVVLALAVAALFFLMPKPQVPAAASRVDTNDNRQARSSNNELSERKNSARINGRIPDIFGTVRSTPDLIAVPYTVFINHQEVEYAYMCIGRGEYEVTDVKDDTTPVSSIAGTSVEIYGPGTSPNSGDPPVMSIGDPIDEDTRLVRRITAVNGETLRAPNDVFVNGNSNIHFVSPNEIRTDDATLNFSDKFEAGDNVVVSNASVLTHLSPSGTATRDFSGTYAITSLDEGTIVLSSPSTVNAAWTGFINTDNCSANMSVTGPRWIGPYIVEADAIDSMMTNVVSSRGLYKDNGTQSSTNVEFEIEVTAVNAAGVALSGAEHFKGTVEGSAVLTTQRALTLQFVPRIINNRYKIRARRITPLDTGFDGSVVDEVKWRDFYTVTEVGDIDFGNITTVHSITYATSGALAIKERKLNALVTRKVPQRVGGAFTTMLYPSNKISDIFCAVAVDPYIGNRTINELDVENIYDTMDEVEAYFGTDASVQFNHTLDNDNLSFEETAALIADAGFCVAYRRAAQIKFFFERATDDSTLLFNHRNKIPGTEVRTVSFGNENDNDGIEYTYTSPVDDAVITYYVPPDRTSINPKKIESIGVRSQVQADFQAYRLWNKLNYQNILCEFDATQEAITLIPNERVLVADNTRPVVYDGEVMAQAGLVVTLSQDVEFKSGLAHRIFLQLYDGTVDSITALPGAVANQVILQTAPNLPLVTDDASFARTTYHFTAQDDRSQIAFLVNEKTAKDGNVVTVKLTNYSSAFYGNDTDFINGLVTEEVAAPTYTGPFIIFIDETKDQIDLHQYAVDNGYTSGNCTIQIVTGIEMLSSNSAVPAIKIGAFPAGSIITIDNSAVITGAGGQGGQGGGYGSGVINGANGGDAIDASMVSGFTVLFSNHSTIRSGGGGGGGGGLSGTGPTNGGGGGGGGQKASGGAGGIGTTVDPIYGGSGANGQTGTESAAGLGGTGGIATPPDSDPGGAGGNGGIFGHAGTAGISGTVATVPTNPGGTAGAAGYAIRGFVNITFVVSGTIIGPTI